MKILILGSEGFIGKHAVKELGLLGYEVFSADIVLKQEPFYFIINPKGANFSDLFLNQKFDVCLNATGAANVQFSFTHPHLDFILNAANVFAILEGIRQHNPTCRFLNLSSAAVYGNPVSLPIKENDNLLPLSPYGTHKVYAEQICKEYFELYGIKTISLRVFSAFGEGLKKQLFWDLFQKVRNTKNGVIEMFGTGKETRDFIYVKDLISAIHHIIQADFFTGTAINIASGVEVSIKEVADFFLEVYGGGVTIKFSGNNKIGDPLNWRADISLLKGLGFKNNYSVKEGIKETVAWQKRQD